MKPRLSKIINAVLALLLAVLFVCLDVIPYLLICLQEDFSQRVSSDPSSQGAVESLNSLIASYNTLVSRTFLIALFLLLLIWSGAKSYFRRKKAEFRTDFTVRFFLVLVVISFIFSLSLVLWAYTVHWFSGG